MGDVGLVTLFNSTNQSANVSILIRRQFAPAPHEEADAEMLFVQIEKQTTIFDNGGELELANLVRSSIMRPDVARLLGIGEAILPAQVPSWLTFPYLRMAHLVHTGAVCDRFGLQAAKVPFGGAKLISAAFGVQASIDSADQYAGYVMAGRFNANLGTVLFSQPNVIQKIIQFRNTTEGEVFRKEIRSQLLANEASAFMASVNAGLIKSIPAPILDNARDKMSSLFTENIAVSPVPAVWSSASQLDDMTRLWRIKAHQRLLALAKQRGVTGNDPCVCGSGDKFRLCCVPPLRG